MSYPEFPVKLELLSKGTKVYKKTRIDEEKNTEVYVIVNAAILEKAPKLQKVPTKKDAIVKPSDMASMSTGTLCYYIAPVDSPNEGHWVPSYGVCTVPIVTDEGQQLHQVDLDSAIVEQAFDMVSWKAGLPPRPDNSRLAEIVTLLMAVQYDKEGGYGSSWKGKGEYRGIVSNIDRKYDRIDKITNDEIKGSRKPLGEQEKLLEQNYDLYSTEVGESKVDAVADLANYCLLYLTWIKNNYPNVFKVWVDRNIPSYLRDKISFLQE